MIIICEILLHTKLIIIFYSIVNNDRVNERVFFVVMFYSSYTVDTTQAFGCVVGEWSEWSICPVYCGYSTSYRTRKVIVSRPIDDCPTLNETKTCGSMRGCKWNYFNNSLWH